MNTRKALLIILLPLAAQAGGVHSGDSSPFSMNTGSSPNGARWVSATASFFLDTWDPCCSTVASGVSNLFGIERLPAQRLLAGKVLDADTGLPLQDAQLALAPGGGLVSSGPNGAFRIDPVAEGGGYQLSAQRAGYHNASLTGIEVEEHRPAFQRIMLEPVRPPAVTGLDISANSDYYYLDWDAVPGVTQYRIRAAWEPNGYWSPVATTGENQYSAPLPAGVEQMRLFRVTALQ